MTLAELMLAEDGEIGTLTDAPSGRPVADAEGRPDDPATYEVLRVHRTRDTTFAVVRGPSGDLDVYGPEPGDLHRDALQDPQELDAWVD